MIKDGKYRYTLQFGMESVEEQRAGELLENMGNKKSPVIVAALNEYIDRHPELLSGKAVIQYRLSTLPPEQLKETIRQLIEERLGSGVLVQPQTGDTSEAPKQVSSDILDMLSDLDCFS